METVEEFIEWKKNRKEKSLEEKFFNEKKELEWNETDTLYSFLGIYVIGLRACYPNKFTRTNFQIRTDKGSNAYSKKIFNNYKEFVDLNELEELKNFIKNYLTIGNLIPIWPGGNMHKGMSQCFDIPEIYFIKHKKITDAFFQVYKNAYMENIIENKEQIKFPNILEMNKEIYKEFLKHIVYKIEYRNNKIMDVLEQKKEFKKDNCRFEVT